MSAPAPSSARHARAAVAPLALAAAGVVGAVALDPVRAWVWLAWLAAPAGAAARRSGLLRAALVPTAWCAAHALRHARAPGWEVWVLLGLFAAGWGLADARGPARSAAGLSLLGLCLLVLPSLGGALGPAPWTPRVAARLLDLSPATWVVESAGVDWMRHPAVYEPVGTDAMGPDVRSALRGPRAASVALALGAALASLGAARTRAR